MYIARWQFTAREGQTDATIVLLRKWMVDVGDRIGWKPTSLRFVQGLIGDSEGHIEMEVQLDSFTDLESAWNDMKGVPYQKQHQRELEPLLVPGSMRWTLHRILDISAED
ncbi:hypothetical protein [Chondromyces apiculatus]|uniref:NIPSNAP domain-containing protein n=1 Tax=Chondromyces apiculatus DSM 436 TaxID=1192034 RepID=A0A017STQ4_9BACT|nr:hypothetical protein [Chondromyces apiculatus]EYF00373.1 Hypothetical protein CAP_0901 [Chondromyces apiculatus DSM 436]